MKVLTRRSLLRLVRFMMVLFILCGLFVVNPARADVGVNPILPGGSNIQSEEDTPIRMAAERVEMSVRQATESDNDLIKLNPEAYGLQFSNAWYIAVAEVHADFTMHNPTGADVTLKVWFPLASALENLSWEINPAEIVPQIMSFAVSVDQNPVEHTTSLLPNPKGEDRPMLPWASFPVTFAAGADTTIQVDYLLPLMQSIKGTPLALYYIFQTGASWAGTIGKAELIVNLPYPASAETIADLPPGSLDNLPYIMAGASPGLPSGVTTENNQARWEWTDFEPGPQDDFSIWVLNPTSWQELEAARAAVLADPENGTKWLQLANIYRSIATVGYNSASAFSSTYYPLGIEAYKKAINLLPDHPSPHAGLALLMLSVYMRDPQAPAEVMGTILQEQATCKDLASRSPYSESFSADYCGEIEFILSFYPPNATATVSAQTTLDAAVLQDPTSTPELPATYTSVPVPTFTPIPTNTDLPQPTVTPAPAQSTSGAQTMLILGAAGIVAIILVGYLVSKRMRGGPS